MKSAMTTSTTLFIHLTVFSSDKFCLTSGGLVAWLDTEAELG